MQAATSFGHWVKQCRGTLQLTQEALAERVGCAVQTIRKIEAGARRPSPLLAERLAQVLDLPPEERPAFLQAARENMALASGDPCNLPPGIVTDMPSLLTFPTRFIGRGEERAELVRLLADPAYRLVSLVGPAASARRAWQWKLPTPPKDSPTAAALWRLHQSVRQH